MTDKTKAVKDIDNITSYFTRLATSVQNRVSLLKEHPARSEESIMDALVGFELDLLTMLIYWSAQKKLDWEDVSLAQAFGQVMEYRRKMHTERIRLSDLETEIDETLEKWYSQRDQGIPEDERVALTDKQRNHIRTESKFDALAKSFAKAENLVGYNTGRPAVSMIELEEYK